MIRINSVCSGLPIQVNFAQSNCTSGRLARLVEIHRRPEGAEGETVRLRDGINIIGRDYSSRSGHVLHDEGGISRAVLAHVLGEDSRPEIVGVAGKIADDDPDGFSLIERRLRLQVRDRRQ